MLPGEAWGPAFFYNRAAGLVNRPAALSFRGSVMGTTIETISTSLRKARSVNQTSSSFVDKLFRVGNPYDAANTSGTGDAATATGASVIKCGIDGGICNNSVCVIPYGTATDGQTCNIRVYGWHDVVGTQSWFPKLLCELQATFDSGHPGVAGGAVVVGELFAKTLTVTYGNANVSCEVVSAATTKLGAHAIVDLKGAKLLEVTFSVGTATSGNALLHQS